MARKFDYPKGTIYGRTRCQDCGSPVNIVADKNGNPYYICGHVSDDLTPCNCRHQIGPIAARKIVAAFEARTTGKKPTKGARHEQDDFLA